MTTEVPVETCTDCPVTADCAALYEDVNAIVMSGRQQDRRQMPGVWGGRDYTAEQEAKAEAGRFRKTVNFGHCKVDGCDTQARAMEMCNKHYQRERAKR